MGSGGGPRPEGRGDPRHLAPDVGVRRQPRARGRGIHWEPLLVRLLQRLGLRKGKTAGREDAEEARLPVPDPGDDGGLEEEDRVRCVAAPRSDCSYYRGRATAMCESDPAPAAALKRGTNPGIVRIGGSFSF